MAACLNEAGRGADQEIDEITAGFRAVEAVGTILAVIVSFVDLVIVKLAAKFQSVCAEDFRERVYDLKILSFLTGPPNVPPN